MLKTVFIHRLSLSGLALLLLMTQQVLADYPKAPDFKLPSRQGEVSLSNLKGKLVYVDFWASWCRPCKSSFPWMIAMKEKFKNEAFEIVAINLDKNRQQANQFIETQDINFIIAFDPDAHIAEHFGVEGMPSSYLIDPDGRLRFRYTGFWNRSKDEKETMIRDLLDEL